MKNNNIIRFVQSLVLLPMITSSLSVANMDNKELPQNAFAPKLNIETKSLFALNKADDSEAEVIKAKAEAIDAYFRERDMPLAGMGMKMATEAEKNGLDWRLVAAISVRESTGGRHACKKASYNAFGWGSCKIGFKSNEEAIETVARNLGGNNPKTAYHYDEKTTIQILRAYNPPSIVPKYAEQVVDIMNTIGVEELFLMSTEKSNS